MSILAGYSAFEGWHWETGSIRNALAGAGVTMPHTGQHPTEALLLGISGGAAVGYFVFEYAGHDPQFILLTRNTFDPMQSTLKRLNIRATERTTVTPSKAVSFITAPLSDGLPVIVFAEVALLPYNAVISAVADDHPVMYPIVVYGYEDEQVYIADRARVPLVISAETLAAARKGSVKDRNRVMTLGAFNPAALVGAVEAGIQACLALYMENPPKGPKDNFGIDALEKWARLLVDERDARGWARLFPPGRALYSGLVTPFTFIETWGTEGAAARGQYADFLDEAAVILSRPSLNEAAAQFRAAIPAWKALAAALLPDEIAPLRRVREALLRSRALFVEHGAGKVDERLALRAEVNALKQELEQAFPLDEAAYREFRAALRDRVLAAAHAEQAAISALAAAMK